MEIIDLNEKKLKETAENISKESKTGDVFFIYGNLGAGKTTFCKYFIKNICINEENISSPTFNIMNVYDFENSKQIIHCDFYRIKSIEEIENLGFYDFIENSITLVEWPEIIEHQKLPNITKIKIEIQSNNLRKLQIIKN